MRKKKNKRMENMDHNNKRNIRAKPDPEEEDEIMDTSPNPELEEQEERIRRELQTLLLFPTTPSESSSSSNHSSSSSNLHEPPPPPPPPLVPAVVEMEVIPNYARPADPNQDFGNNNNNHEVPPDIVIDPPFPWATDRPTKIHSIKYLLQNNISDISGDVQCGSCHGIFEISYDLQEKVAELRSFMRAHRSTMHSRSPKEWIFPELLTCILCGKEKRVKPVIGNWREHNINWLFLLLGQLIGFCTLDDMRYFCSYNGLHKTAAKDRFVYYTYVKLFMMISRDS
ncbi:hypothetical protein PIB30_019756 [Stylosanthes scabra]|uniref:DUF7086 domain-containing protein n=1 Tax=Stylosanthes scabra TaxID=79078 RepID=A0ABU6X9S1_9FABA|nr:hypothetical protein [Stylosanthes scabra]